MDISDPIGGGMGEYEKCQKEIEQGILGVARYHWEVKAQPDMRVAVASDHRGVAIKRDLLTQISQLGHEAIDMGPDDVASVDYPDYALKVAKSIHDGTVDRGVLICGTGIGMCIAANKYPGVLAAPCHDELTAKMSRLHNDANVLCFSAELLGDQLISRMVETWLTTEFEGGRHARRIEKIRQIENSHEEYLANEGT